MCLNDEVDQATSASIVAQLLFLEADNPDKPINLYINSPGGSVTAGMDQEILVRTIVPLCHFADHSLTQPLDIDTRPRDLRYHDLYISIDYNNMYGPSCVHGLVAPLWRLSGPALRSSPCQYNGPPTVWGLLWPGYRCSDTCQGDFASTTAIERDLSAAYDQATIVGRY